MANGADGERGDLVKLLGHDGVGMSLYIKRREAGKFIWPAGSTGAAIAISAAQLGYLLEGIDWRNPRWTQRQVTCQLGLQLEELEATEDEIMANKAIATAPNPLPNDRRRPSRKPFPAHLPRERVVIAAPAACPWLAVRPGS